MPRIGFFLKKKRDERRHTSRMTTEHWIKHKLEYLGDGEGGREQGGLVSPEKKTRGGY